MMMFKHDMYGNYESYVFQVGQVKNKLLVHSWENFDYLNIFFVITLR